MRTPIQHLLIAILLLPTLALQGAQPATADCKDDPRLVTREQYHEVFKGVSKAMDRVAADVEEFGSVAMSIPLLTLPTPKLSFGLDNDAKTYYDHARTEVAGRALSIERIAQAFSGDLRGSADVDAMAAAKGILGGYQLQNQNYQNLLAAQQKQAQSQLKLDLAKANDIKDPAARQQAITAAYETQTTILGKTFPAQKPTFPSETDRAIPTIPTVINNGNATTTKDGTADATKNASSGANKVTDTSGAASGAAAPAVPANTDLPRVDQTLVTSVAIPEVLPGFTTRDASGNPVTNNTGSVFDDNIRLPDTDAVIAAESAKSLQSLSNFFHSPTEAAQFDDKIVMMGAVTVSVMPGWRTRKSFAAEVSVQTRYVWRPARRETLLRMGNDPTLPENLKDKLAAIAKDGRNFAADPEEGTDGSGGNVSIQRVKGQTPSSKPGSPGKTKPGTPGAPILHHPAPGNNGPNNNGPNPNMSPAIGRNEDDHRVKGHQRRLTGSEITSADEALIIPPELRYNPDQEYLSPLVAGISPLMETQTLDLASEYARQDQFAFTLALALQGGGWKAQGRVFEQFVKNQKNQVQTRSTSASVATYSNGGGIIGFQIGPRLKAIGDPANRKSKAENILERQSFPALLVFGLDAVDLYPKIEQVGDGIAVWEPVLEITQQTHWLPTTHRFNSLYDWFNPLNGWPPGWNEHAYTEKRKIDASLMRIEAFQDLHDMFGRKPCPTGDALYGKLHELSDNLDARVVHDQARALGTKSRTRFPAALMVPNGRVPLPGQAPAGGPEVDKVLPASVQTQPTVLSAAELADRLRDTQIDLGMKINAYETAVADYTQKTTDLKTALTALAGKPDDIKKLAQAVSGLAADKNPTDDQTNAVQQLILGSQKLIAAGANDVKNFKDRVAELKAQMAAATIGVDNVKATYRALNPQAQAVGAKVKRSAFLTSGSADAFVLKLNTSAGNNIDLVALETLTTGWVDAAGALNTATKAWLSALDPATTESTVDLAILGDRLDKVATVEMIRGGGASIAQIYPPVKRANDGTGGWVTALDKKSIQIKAVVNHSEMIYFRLTYPVDDITQSANPPMREVITKPVFVRFGNTPFALLGEPPPGLPPATRPVDPTRAAPDQLADRSGPISPFAGGNPGETILEGVPVRRAVPLERPRLAARSPQKLLQDSLVLDGDLFPISKAK